MPTIAELLGQVDLSGDGGLADFDEEPVPLDVFVRDVRYLANPPLSEVQYEAVRHIERVYMPETYAVLAGSADRHIRTYWRRSCRMVNLIDLEWGKGAGKDHICRISALRVSYLLMCLRSPLAYYLLPEQDSIHILNVASSAPQARRAFFAPMRRAVLRPRNWFQTLGVDVLEGPRGRPKKEGESTQALMDTIRFAKQIEAVSGHSDADTQEGLNLILGIADEIDAFRSRAELARTGGLRARESSASAESVLEMLRTSGSTRFPKVYKNVRISYPRYKGSTIQKLIAEGEADIEAKGAASRHYVSGPLSTWDVNPRIHGKEDFADDYEKDPVMAAAKYECRPSFAVNPYFSNEIALRACVNPGYQAVNVDYVRDGAAWRPVYVFSDKFYPVRGALYAMHADLAVTGDRAGVALAHVKTWKEVTVLGADEAGLEVGFTEQRPVVKVDFVFGYEADRSKQPPLEIQIRWAGDLCLELQRRGFPIVLFTADQYQSVDLRQRLETRGIETDRFSLDKDELGWKTLRDVAYEGRYEMPDVELALTELLQLSRLPNGKIDHPADGSKDLADALGGAVSGAIRIGGREEDSGARAYPGGEHQFGGLLDRMVQAPIGMPPLEALVSDEILPQEIRDREIVGLGFTGGWLDDFGESKPHST